MWAQAIAIMRRTNVWQRREKPYLERQEIKKVAQKRATLFYVL